MFSLLLRQFQADKLNSELFFLWNGLISIKLFSPQQEYTQPIKLCDLLCLWKTWLKKKKVIFPLYNKDKFTRTYPISII